ncbi:serine/threonine-protein kinase BRI1-like 1 [Actinobacteria bacterium YIM 96077]|uniref:Serine/threonine-protein kinase BRI1-like 1 n=1 Tax=Phytoactinopolyspora halophila TaxID=1981511 RepID=A0A329QW65_9ACTN|nr:SRPBCC domain-containing protein [Phytoactinopolyspora halophila]AYY13906.1 serine/threonine-protein kinase BRI1-like 1 [Actinobacteria bacterium YIM 96077]RAW15552.1 serine/threonine-protein kinase BRI1-like 1 [Phytoactinopolyspora halophila]
MSTQDRIEQQVVIDAPVARVWKLVTEPGWWIGDGNDRTGQRRYRDGDLDVVEDPRFGRFPVRTETTEPQHYVSYRWASTFPGEDLRPDNSTLVEFWLSEHDGGTLLRVVESGFASLAVPDEARERSVNGNIEGWVEQLTAIQKRAEQSVE